MHTISDLMTRDVRTLTGTSTLLEAEKLMREFHVRHIPVVDDDHRIVGVLSQREFLREAFRITDKFGAHHLQDYLAKTQVGTCIASEICTLPADTPLQDAGRRLQDDKQGCLMVTDDTQHLLGIATSQDFVKLSMVLLTEH